MNKTRDTFKAKGVEPTVEQNNQKVLENLELLESRTAQSFTGLADALSANLNQYAAQTQIIFELAKEPFGFEISPQAQQYKELMEEETKRQEAAAKVAEQE